MHLETTLTVMFVDIDGSTALIEDLGDESASRVIGAEVARWREEVVSAGGRPLRELGDGMLAVFPAARAALRCALAIQVQPWRPANRLRVRVGIHSGDVLEEPDAISGAAVHVAARVTDAARGGRVLLTEAVRHLAGRMPEFRFIDRGEFVPRGLNEHVRLSELRPLENARVDGQDKATKILCTSRQAGYQPPGTL